MGAGVWCGVVGSGVMWRVLCGGVWVVPCLPCASRCQIDSIETRWC